MNNWYDDIDVATLQRIKTYSAFCDYKSQNLMLQTLYEAMQKKIDEYKKTNREIAKDFAALRKQVPQWHKVADADLPEAENHFWSRTVLIQTNKGSSIIGFYDHANKAWYEKSTDDIVYGVVVWCEIPKYTEE